MLEGIMLEESCIMFRPVSTCHLRLKTRRQLDMQHTVLPLVTIFCKKNQQRSFNLPFTLSIILHFLIFFFQFNLKAKILELFHRHVLVCSRFLWHSEHAFSLVFLCIFALHMPFRYIYLRIIKIIRMCL